jgi:uncharacterized protein YuzE
MKIKYFPDTDTLLMEFNNSESIDTQDLNERALAEFDKTGRLARLTIEHFKEMVA